MKIMLIKTSLSIILLVYLLSFEKVSAQKLTPLKPGDKVPNILLNLKNAPTESIQLADMKGKLVILDFWNRYCGSCIEGFPKLDSFQQKYGDKIQIILVTSDNNKQVEAVKKLSKKVRDVTLPMVIADTTLSQLFPYNAVPIHVWIDASGRFMQQTASTNTTDDNIHAYIAGQHLTLPPYNNHFTPGKPLWSSENVHQLQAQSHYSLFTGWIDYMKLGKRIETDSLTNKIVFLQFYNMPVFSLVKFSLFNHYPELSRMNNRWILEVENPLNYKEIDKNTTTEWIKKNTFTYELRISPDNPYNIFDVMLIEIQRYYGLDISVEKRNVKALALVKTTKAPAINPKSKGGLQYIGGSGIDEATNHFHNVPVSRLTLALNNLYPNLPIIDRTGYLDNIDMEITYNTTNTTNRLSDLKKQLRKYGFDLVEGTFPLDMFILREKQDNHRSNINGSFVNDERKMSTVYK